MAVDQTLAIQDQILALDARLSSVENLVPMNGIIVLPPPPPPPPPPLSTLVLWLSADVYQGNPQFNVSMDGIAIGTGIVSTLHSTGKSQLFTYTGAWATGTHTVTITFFGDAYGGTPALDKNLYVDGMDYNGAHFPKTAALMSNGTSVFTVSG